MGDPVRISPQDVHSKLQAGDPTLLVCAYANDEKFKENALEGAISYGDLQSKLTSLATDNEIVFYCA